jgi:hypothetical protein
VPLAVPALACESVWIKSMSGFEASVGCATWCATCCAPCVSLGV